LIGAEIGFGPGSPGAVNVAVGSKAEKLQLSKCLLLFPQQRTFIKATTADSTLIDAARENPELIDKFADWLIALSSGGLSVLNSKFLRMNHSTGPHPLRARELTTPRPEGLTARLVPVEVDLKPQIFDVCSSLNNGHSPKGRLRQLCAKTRLMHRSKQLVFRLSNRRQSVT
jgi:hypothetical protein